MNDAYVNIEGLLLNLDAIAKSGLQPDAAYTEVCARAIRQLERDAALLNELEQTKCYPFWNGSEWVYIVAAERSSKVERRGVGKTIREAIDAGMGTSIAASSELNNDQCGGASSAPNDGASVPGTDSPAPLSGVSHATTPATWEKIRDYEEAWAKFGGDGIRSDEHTTAFVYRVDADRQWWAMKLPPLPTASATRTPIAPCCYPEECRATGECIRPGDHDKPPRCHPAIESSATGKPMRRSE